MGKGKYDFSDPQIRALILNTHKPSMEHATYGNAEPDLLCAFDGQEWPCATKRDFVLWELGERE